MATPVIILPDDAVQYTPGDFVPPGAVINTPIPGWVWILFGVILVAAIVLLSSVIVSADGTTLSPTMIPTATSGTISNLLKTSLVSVQLITFTPSPKKQVLVTPKPQPGFSFVTPVIMGDKLTGTPADQKLNVSAVVWPISGRVGSEITATIKSTAPGSVSLRWDDQEILHKQISQGDTLIPFFVPNTGVDKHLISLVFDAPGFNPYNQTTVFEVIK